MRKNRRNVLRTSAGCAKVRGSPSSSAQRGSIFLQFYTVFLYIHSSRFYSAPGCSATPNRHSFVYRPRGYLRFYTGFIY